MSNDKSKQEYLKRYLEDSNPEKKTKKKIKKNSIPRMKIIDQDITIKSINFGTDEVKEEDDLPVVAEVIDDRPVEIKSKEIYESSKWKRLGDDTAEKSPYKQQDKPLKNHSKKQHDSDEDLSPVKVSRQRHDSDSDISPPRKQINRINQEDKISSKTSNSKRHHDSGSDLSPVRVNRTRHDSDSDISPPRIKQSNTNKSDKEFSSKSSKISTKRYHASDSDLSPERPNRSKVAREAKHSDSDLSPERPKRRRSHSNDEDSDLSPPRKDSQQQREENSLSSRPTKTLSGLKAGLQNATTLRRETEELRQREKKQIKELDAELSGRHASTIIRDRSTGRKRDVEGEQQVDEEKEKRKQEQQKKYDQWGKGIMQTENQKIKLSEDLYEMSKPLARYCGDEDLEEQLKAEIHDDDPMAQYMRKKKGKKATSIYPTYNGPPPPPNRFNIPPGYRWDGVDRSNGFEKKYFEQNTKKAAAAEEAYLWSVQEM